MNFRFHSEALDEYEEAAIYLESRRPGLGSRFTESIEHAIASILEAPEQFPAFGGDVRRCLAHVFPYAVLYSIEENYVLIVAVMHSRREPGYWRDRVLP